VQELGEFFETALRAGPACAAGRFVVGEEGLESAAEGERA